MRDFLFQCCHCEEQSKTATRQSRAAGLLRRCASRNDGFSLVELSIVLVILGLLTGGILTGQNLIRNAELRSVPTEFQAFQTAVYTFRDKYFALPGDMTNATDFWGEAHADPATCKTTISTGTETCNGDGDGKILDASFYNESYRFWQHLANAGLLEGTYSGVSGPGHASSHATPDNVAKSKLSNGYWTMLYWGNSPNHTENFKLTHNFQIGGLIANSWNNGNIFTNEEAWNIDTKIDDGKPATGFAGTAVNNTFNSNCASSDLETATYQLQNPDIGCTMAFKLE